MRSDPVRERIRVGLRSGELPRNRPGRISGGYGSATICVCCKATIGESQIRLTLDGPATAMHPRCAQVWFEEADWAMALAASA